MATEKFTEKIHDAVINNRLEEALDELEKLTNDIDLQAYIVLLKSRLKNLQREKTLGIDDDRASDKELNRIRMGVMEILKISTKGGQTNKTGEIAVLENLLEMLENNNQTFFVQTRIRNSLVKSLRERFPDIKTSNIMKLMSTCYEKMNSEERKMHNAIRGYTEKGIKKYNEEIYKLIEAYPEVKDKVPKLKKLQQHIRLWLIKYDSIFVSDESVSLIYMNIQERVPFPKGIENDIKEYLERNDFE